jgi:hypothetical protein
MANASDSTSLAPSSPQPGLYDDLVPGAQLAAPAQASSSSSSAPSLYADLVPRVPGAPAKQAAPAYDPSAGGGRFQVYVPGLGAVDTGLNTPQWLDRTLAGAGRGITHTLSSAGNVVGLVPDQALKDEAATDKPLLNTTAGTVGNLIGESAITAPIGAGAVGAVGRAGALGARAAASPLVSALMQGGVQGAVTSDPGSRATNATIGAVTGGALGAGSTAVSKLVGGLTQSPAAQVLRRYGVNSLTPGQANPAGVANQFEQVAEHIPVLGGVVQTARDAAQQDYQRAVIQAAAAPGAKITPSENVHDMLQQAYNSFEPLYSQAKGAPVAPATLDAMTGRVANAAATTPGTSQGSQQAAQSFLDDAWTRLPDNPTTTDLLQLRSNIRQAARKANLSTDTVAQDKAAIYGNAEQHVTGAIESSLNPDQLAALQSADSQYGNYKIVENAVAASKDNIAGLTPQKLSQAVYNATADPAYARGAGGPLRELAQAGTQTFQTVVPPTGASLIPLGAGAAAVMHNPALAVPAGAALLGGAGTQVGRNFAAGLTAPQVGAQKLAAALRQAVPANARAPLAAIAGRGATGAAMPYTPQTLATAYGLAGLLPAPAAADTH